MNEAKAFSDYVNTLRAKNQISLQDLCRGLCTHQELSYLETGSRQLDMLLEDAILERLGVGAEDHERYLDYPEYQRWLDRHHILHSITFEKFAIAEQQLEEYRKIYCRGTEPDHKAEQISRTELGDQSRQAAIAERTNRADDNDKRRLPAADRLERQFYLSMLALLRRCQGADAQELYSLFEEALRLTVPDFDRQPLCESILSLKELNLILEAERCRADAGSPQRYQEIIAYLFIRKLDRRGMSKIYPKAVYYLYETHLRQSKNAANTLSGACSSGTTSAFPPQTRNQLLRHCNRALETLRDNGRMYFLWEILSMMEALLAELADYLAGAGNANVLNAMRHETRDWKQALEIVYSEFHVPKETFEYCYLYVIKGCYCINDVIRIRRKMLGMTQEELCEGICSLKTLKRLENRKTSPQKAIVRDLFERLGLSRELTRTDLITSSPEAKQLMERLKRCDNDYRIEDAGKLLSQINDMTSSEIRHNKQCLLRKELFLKRSQKLLNSTEYRKQIRATLELTLPYDAFLKEGEKHLTKEEQSCIQNMMQAMQKDEEELLICMHRFEEIYHPFLSDGIQDAVSGMYEFIIGYIGNLWGNMGQYEKADKYNEIILQGCLRFKRLIALPHCLYDRWWNYSERTKQGIPTAQILNTMEELNKCLLFSKLSNQNHSVQFYQKKLNMIENNV